jgi:5-methylcytosine-specific restriction endonuclease McrA
MKRRSGWIRPKPREKKVLWRTGQVKEDAAGMKVLRRFVFKRAGGKCEVIKHGKRCGRYAPWDGYRHGELSHIVSRKRGGSDTPANTEWACFECHRTVRHKGPQWSGLVRKRALEAGENPPQPGPGLDADIRGV